MSEQQAHTKLIRSLAADLRIARPLAQPWKRALLWSLAVALLAVFVVGVGHPWQTPSGPPPAFDLLRMAVPPALTAFAAAWAAFETSIPGSKRAWALLPIPPFAVWMVLSGLGCLMHWLTPDKATPDGPPPAECITFILLVSLPLCGLLFVMLKRAMPLEPSLTSLLAGLAAAAASATLLSLAHPSDAAILDLLAHAVAVLVVVGAGRLAGLRYFGTGSR